MKSLNTKLALAAVAVALLASPAFAQKPVHHYRDQAPDSSQIVHDPYPNPQISSGSEESRESGNEFNGAY